LKNKHINEVILNSRAFFTGLGSSQGRKNLIHIQFFGKTACIQRMFLWGSYLSYGPLQCKGKKIEHPKS
jgi:hypothetical protein